MTFGQFIRILRARRWAALGVFVAVVMLAVGTSLLLPRQYTGAASVVVDVKPDPLSALAYPASALPGFMATQVDIITSNRVTLRVIRDLKMLDDPELRRTWTEEMGAKGNFQQWLVEVLQKQLEVKPSRESNVIQIEYKARLPGTAALLANAFAQAYLTTTLELRVDPAKQFASFFSGQAKEAREALEKAQTRLSGFQREKGIVASDERLDVENSRLGELSTQLVQIEAIASESGSRQAQAQGAANDRTQEVLGNSLISSLRADLSRNEARLQELNARLGESHPQVQEAQASIAEVRRKIDGEIRRVSGGATVTNTINRQREAQIRRELADQRAKVLQMKAVRDAGQVLVREVENAQRSFDAMVARLNQTAMEAQSTQSYANMLTTAQPPSEPSSPKLLLNTVLAVFAGVLLGVGVALLRELLDRRVRSPDDIVRSLGLSVLGTLPKPGAKRFIAGTRVVAAAGSTLPQQGNP